MKVLLFVFLALCLFLFGVNLNLHGRKTKNVETILGLLILAFIIAIFVFYGWKVGAVTLLVAYLVAIPISKVIGVYFAGKIRGY